MWIDDAMNYGYGTQNSSVLQRDGPICQWKIHLLGRGHFLKLSNEGVWMGMAQITRLDYERVFGVDIPSENLLCFVHA